MLILHVRRSDDNLPKSAPLPPPLRDKLESSDFEVSLPTHRAIRVSWSLVWPQTHHVAEVDLKLPILPPPPPECREFWYAPPCLVYVVLGIKPTASCTLDKHFTHWSPSLRPRLKHLKLHPPCPDRIDVNNPQRFNLRYLPTL